MWEMVWKERRHAWANTLLGIGKISINMFAWILAYAIYSKSVVFVRKAKKILEKPEYMDSDLLAREKIELVHLSGVFLTGIIVVGIAVLYWYIVTSDMKRRRGGTARLLSLGYERKQVGQYYICHMVMDICGSAAVSVTCALVAWQLFLGCSGEYVEMLEVVGMDKGMDLAGVLYALLLAVVLWMAALLAELVRTGRRNLRGQLAS